MIPLIYEFNYKIMEFIAIFMPESMIESLRTGIESCRSDNGAFRLPCTIDAKQAYLSVFAIFLTG